MKTKKMVVYFGAGGASLGYCHQSGKMPDIFVDNDSSKWGTVINGVEVVSPEVLTSIPLQRITITSGYIKDIFPQILSLGVDQDKIHIPPKSLLGFHPFAQEINRIQAATKLNEIMVALSDRWNIVAVAGAALGFCRNNDFIHWDFDVDLFTPNQSKPALLHLLQELDYADLLRGIDYEPECEFESIEAIILLENNFKVPLDITFFDPNSDTVIDRYEDYTWEWPIRMFTNCARVEVHGKLLNVPNPPEEYLAKVYGPSWSVPNPEFGYSDYGGGL